MATRTWPTVLAVVAVALLAACDSEAETATTRTTTPSSTSSTRADPADKAPPVREPLNVDTLVAAPCSSLTATQLADLQLGSGYNENPHPRPENAWLACSFDDLDPTTGLVVFLDYVRHEQGIGDLYSSRAQPQSEWTSFEIDGYPAVRYQLFETANDCDVAVGINDTEYFRVQVFDPDVAAGRDTCGMAIAISTAVLATIKAAN